MARNFSARSGADQEWLLRNTWCDACRKADLGMIEPIEYEEDGVVFVEGKCSVCGTAVRSSITETEVDE